MKYYTVVMTRQGIRSEFRYNTLHEAQAKLLTLSVTSSIQKDCTTKLEIEIVGIGTHHD